MPDREKHPYAWAECSTCRGAGYLGDTVCLCVPNRWMMDRYFEGSELPAGGEKVEEGDPDA